MAFRRSARGACRRGAKAAEALMIEHCRIVRFIREETTDYTQKQREVLVYEGKCKVQTYEPDAIERSSLGRPIVLQEDRLHLPLGAGPFEIGDMAFVEGRERPYRIDGLIGKTFETAQRLKVTAESNRGAADE